MPDGLQGDDRGGVAAGDLPVRLVSIPVLILAPVAGWLFAEHADPGGALMRWTLGWLVGEFR